MVAPHESRRIFKHIDSLATHLDAKDSDKVMEFLTEDCRFQAANNAIVQGKEQIKDVLEDFFTRIKSTKHEVNDIIESTTSLIHRGTVTYTRIDNTKLTVPFCDVFKMRKGRIAEYNIYIDWSELFK